MPYTTVNITAENNPPLPPTPCPCLSVRNMVKVCQHMRPFGDPELHTWDHPARGVVLGMQTYKDFEAELRSPYMGRVIPAYSFWKWSSK